MRTQGRRHKDSPDKPRLIRTSATWHFRDRRPATRPVPCQLPQPMSDDRCASPQMHIADKPCGGGVESLLGPSGLYVHSIEYVRACQGVVDSIFRHDRRRCAGAPSLHIPEIGLRQRATALRADWGRCSSLHYLENALRKGRRTGHRCGRIIAHRVIIGGLTSTGYDHPFIERTPDTHDPNHMAADPSSQPGSAP